MLPADGQASAQDQIVLKLAAAIKIAAVEIVFGLEPQTDGWREGDPDAEAEHTAPIGRALVVLRHVMAPANQRRAAAQEDAKPGALGAEAQQQLQAAYEDLRIAIAIDVVPETRTRAGAKPPVSLKPTGLRPHVAMRAPMMKLLSRRISPPTVLNELRVGTYAPGQGVREKPLWAAAGAAPKATATARAFVIRYIRLPPYWVLPPRTGTGGLRRFCGGPRGSNNRSVGVIAD